MKTIRRLYFYLVALVSLEVVTWALITLARSIFVDRLSDTLAGGLAFILVGLPVFLFHWRFVQREAAEDKEERFSGVRAVFLYAAWISLAVPVVQNLLSIVLRLLAILFNVNENAIAIGGYQNWSDNIIAILVNAVLAGYIFTVLQQDWQADPPEEAFPLVRQLNRYLWVLYGLGLTYAGTLQLLQFIIDRLRSTGFRFDVSLVNALGFILIGVPLWLYSWQIVQQVGRPSKVRSVTLYALSLLSAFATLISLGSVLLITLHTAFGRGSWANAWSDLQVAISILLPSAAVWAYHWTILKQDIALSPSEVQQHSQRRLYFYLLSLAGLIGTFVSLEIAVNLLIEAFFCSSSSAIYANSCQWLLEVQLPNVIAVLLVSVPVWVLHWRPSQSRALQDDEVGENVRGALLRRGYLYLVLFAGVIGSMVTTGWLLYELLSSLLGFGDSGSLNVILNLLGALVLFLVFTYYHWRLLRMDGEKLDEITTARQQAFPVVVAAQADGFTEKVQQVMAALAPDIPLIIQPVGEPLVEGVADAKAVIFPSDTLIDSDSDLRNWLNSFSGEKLVVPTTASDWVWLGLTEQSLERQIRQAVRVIQQLAEAGDSKAARSLSPGTVVAYVFGALLALIIFCTLTTGLIEVLE